MSRKILNIGVIGAGEVAQVIHLPTLQLLNHLYRTVAICDISQNAIEFCSSRHHIPKGTIDPSEIINSPDIDLIFILTSDEFHETYTIAALGAGKHVMVEKPLSLCLQSAQRIVEAEKSAKNGARVFVGYMRCYALSFVSAFKREIASINKILYGRSRGIVRPNAFFVSQSGTSATKFVNLPPEAHTQRTKLLNALLQEAFPNQEVTYQRRDYCRFLGSLGSDDISLMREVLDFPESVAGATTPFTPPSSITAGTACPSP